MLHAVIMAGGSGTRFWPASRRLRPKQFLSWGRRGPLLRSTFERVLPLVSAERTWVITSAETVELTRALLPELPEANIVGEPAARDTAACVGLAAHLVQHRDPSAVCLVLPADHVVGRPEQFRAAMAAGAAHVGAAGGLLTFGLRPTRPETGFGYLRIADMSTTVNGLPVHPLERFVEKPDPDTAQSYVDDGRYLWNSGIFAWRCSDILAEINRQLPQLAAGLSRIADADGTSGATAALEEIYPTLHRTSVDFGVMEGAQQCWTLPVDFPWSDVGSWPAVAEVLESDNQGNAVSGRSLAEGCRGCLVISDGPVVAAVGLEKVVVVATDDAVLVVPADKAQMVKDAVDRMRGLGWDDVL